MLSLMLLAAANGAGEKIKNFFTSEIVLGKDFTIANWHLLIAIVVLIALIVVIAVFTAKAKKKSQPVEEVNEEVVEEDETEKEIIDANRNIAGSRYIAVATPEVEQVKIKPETQKVKEEELATEETTAEEPKQDPVVVKEIEKISDDNAEEITEEPKEEKTELPVVEKAIETEEKVEESEEKPEVVTEKAEVKEEKAETVIEKPEEVKKEKSVLNEEKSEAAATVIATNREKPISQTKNTQKKEKSTTEVKKEMNKNKHKTETKAEPKVEHKTETKAEPKVEHKSEPKVEHKAETKAEHKAESKATAKPVTNLSNKPAYVQDTAEPKVNGKIEICNSDLGGYNYLLRANNGQLLYESKAYKTIEGCRDAIDKFIEAVNASRFTIRADKFKNYKFILKSPTSNTLLYIGESFSTEISCKNNIESVKRFAPSSVIVDLTEEDFVSNFVKYDISEETKKLVESGHAAVGKWEIVKIDENVKNSPFVYLLFANNGQLLYESRDYKTIASCRNGLETFVNTVKNGFFVIDPDKSGRFKFVLRNMATNSPMEYYGQNYDTQKACASSIESVYHFALTSPIPGSENKTQTK